MNIDSAIFEGFTIPPHMTNEMALDLVKQCTVYPEHFHILNNEDKRVLVWK
ncbi:hypothetical protein [Kurthia senegalensis]|uniref:hypothetical protein n=1 Tax=Kurthia senegalensis TaxID=1033740 RepID=UPI00030E7D1F|nr:hypothetical protein [Kurthia senegalensis]